MCDNKKYLVLAFYHFPTIDNPQAEIKAHLAFFKDKDVTSRIYISYQGINGQMSALAKDAEAYMKWMHSREMFKDVVFKIHESHEHVFPRLTVKFRNQLVAYVKDVDLKNCGEHVSPQEWKKMLQEEESKVVVDVRNNYEWDLGHFEGAERPPCDSFRDFESYANQLKESIDPETTPVMMYCTGGIRCEFYSSILKEKGFERVYQLDGGVINYGLKEGSDHWLGKLFVFDDRLTVPVGKEGESPVIGKCYHCKEQSEAYYNCSNMDCNALFLCCPTCVKEFAGCCQQSCKEAKHVRPYHEHSAHKPFRRWHEYFKEKPVSVE